MLTSLAPPVRVTLLTRAAMKCARQCQLIAHDTPPLADTLPRPDTPSTVEWLPVDQIETLLIEELGYEDQPEFEDALRGSFLDFLDGLLHARIKEESGRCVQHTAAQTPFFLFPVCVREPPSAAHTCHQCQPGMTARN
jgi:hypothetical protein